MTFNGEIYNFQELRQELEALGGKFRGHSDTEVFLESISRWGVEKTVSRSNGMFAFAVWDRELRVLHLCRDRIGEKPLYYGWMDKAFVFASELKAFLAQPGFRRDIDRNALALYMRYNYVPAPHTIYKNVYKLPPGTILTVRPGNPADRPSPISYWPVKDMVKRGLAERLTVSEGEAREELHRYLLGAVKLRMVADVPLGAFLSGGIDSSTVVALMQAQSIQPIKTFTIGFQETPYDEACHAEGVAKHLGTDHTQLYVTPQQARDVIPRLPFLYDEPFADSSQIPTFLVSQLARKDVTVALSGDGGDEIFGGYNRYFWSQEIWRAVGWLPGAARRAVSRALSIAPRQAWDAAVHHCNSLLPKALNLHLPGDKIQKLAEVITAANQYELYHGLLSHWKQPCRIVVDASEPLTPITDENCWVDFKDFREHMMYLDLVTYLPDDILVKVDRASMGVGLEARLPLLDHRVVEFAWQMPMPMKIHGKQGKRALRWVLNKYVPLGLVDRPKMGFGVPLDSWLRGPLREWAEELLDESRLRREGYFHPAPVRKTWEEHLSGRRNWQYRLWNVLMFQLWVER